MLGLTFDYGQRAAPREIQAARSICEKYDVKHQVIELPWYALVNPNPLLDRSLPLPELRMDELDDESVTQQSAKAVWIPNRNGVFLNVAATLAESLLANWIIVGFNAEEAETFPDNSLEFVEAANAFFKFSTNGKVSLVSPMGTKTKKEIVSWCVENGADLSLLWSCYRGDDKMCGVCESCLRLKRALAQAEAHDWAGKLF